MVRTWISFRELYQDENEPEDRGISLENPMYNNWGESEEEGADSVEFSVTDLKLNGETAKEWAEHQFEVENCSECGKGAEGHDIIEFMGNWFARCKEEST